MASYYIGLGAREGNAVETIARAIRRLAAEHELVACSSLYLAHPWGGGREEEAEDQDRPPSVNAVVQIESSHTPLTLLIVLKRLEVELGRREGPREGPRAIDLDILLSGDLVYSGFLLSVPHPRITERGSVLAPLLELSPDLVHPILGVPLALFWEDLSRRGEGPVPLRIRRHDVRLPGRRNAARGGEGFE